MELFPNTAIIKDINKNDRERNKNDYKRIL